MKDKAITVCCQAWRRPDGPLNVWRTVEGQQKLEDGTTRPVKFSIQEVPETRYQEAMDFMMKYFAVDEPINKALNLKSDPVAVDDLRLIWEYCLEQGIVVAAYALDARGEISELAAFNMLSVTSDETDKEMQQLQGKFKSAKFKKILDSMGKISAEADARKVYGVDKYIGALGLTVSHKYRGQKLGLHLLEARTAIGRKYGIPATSTVFTARGSQILAERAGFQTQLVQNYAEVLGDNGKPFFAGIESKDMRVMMKRLY